MNFTKVFWGLFAAGVLGVVALFYALSSDVFGKLPGFEELENPESALATEIISTDGVVIGKYYAQNRSNIDYSNLPLCLRQALIATEDVRFEDHTGVDIKALFRAVLSGGSKGGGSTITQQLAKV